MKPLNKPRYGRAVFARRAVYAPARPASSSCVTPWARISDLTDARNIGRDKPAAILVAVRRRLGIKKNAIDLGVTANDHIPYPSPVLAPDASSRSRARRKPPQASTTPHDAPPAPPRGLPMPLPSSPGAIRCLCPLVSARKSPARSHLRQAGRPARGTER